MINTDLPQLALLLVVEELLNASGRSVWNIIHSSGKRFIQNRTAIFKTKLKSCQTDIVDQLLFEVLVWENASLNVKYSKLYDLANVMVLHPNYQSILYNTRL